MRRLTTLMLAAVAALIVTTGSVAAQARAGGSYIALGGGLTIPSGDQGDVSKTGWNALVQAGAEMRSGLGLRGEIYYGENSAQLGDGKFKFVGGLGSVKFTFRNAGKLQPYLVGTVGIMNAKFAGFDGDTKMAFGGGAGIDYRMARTSNLFVEGRYLSINDDPVHRNLIPIQVGIRFGL
jgi:hypothetical protein